MEHQYRIEHEGIVLRPLEHSDIESLRVWRNDPSNGKYIRKLPYITPEMQESWFESDAQDETSLTFAICDGVELVGSVALYDIHGETAEFGRLMIGGAKRRGFGRLATEAVLLIAFRHMGIKRVIATVSVDNVPALSIYTLMGFRITGLKYCDAAQMNEFDIELEQERFNALRAVRYKRSND